MKVTVRANGLIALAVLTVFAAALSACGQSSAADPGTEEKINAAVTIYPTLYFTAEVGGDRLEITELIQPGTDAHDFEPTPSDIRAINEADLVVFNHPAFETWVADARGSVEEGIEFVQLADLPGLEASREDETGHEAEDEHRHEGEIDPHVWLDPVEAIEMVHRIRDALSRIDPDGASVYQANASALIGRLESLDDRFSAGLASCRHSTFVASHLAYGHLSERYGLEQLGLSGLSDEAESGPQHVAEIVEHIRELGLTAILVEPLSNQALAETVANETSAQLLPLHPLESLTEAQEEAGDDYFSVMERNLDSLRTALDCSG